MNPDKKLKILITGPDISNFSGGIQTHIQNFLEVFKGHKKIQISFFPTTLGLYKNESWASKIIRNFGFVVPFIVKIKKTDRLHLNSTFDNRSVLRDSSYALLSILFKKQVIIQFHGGRANQVSLFANGFFKQAIMLVLKRCKNILILSKEQDTKFKRIFPNIKTTLTNNYINTEKLKQKQKIKNKKIVFLFLGRIHEDKGIKQIVEAAVILRNINIDYKLHFCGKGPLLSWLDNAIKDNCLTENVFYEGVVSGEDKKKFLQESNIMLLPSKNEGFPYSILESFCYKMPVISTFTGAIPDIIEEGINGFLIEYDNASELAEKMLYCCWHPKEVSDMGIRSRKKAESLYSFEKMQNFFEDIYK